MFNLVRWYNQNREKFWLVILIIFAIIFFIQVANNFYKQKQDLNTNNNLPSITSTSKNDINNKISGTLQDTTSLVEGFNISTKKLENATSIIDTFIIYCNNGKLEEAYNLLTDECKEEVFPSLESFKNKYYNNVFDTYKTYTIQNWVVNTYKIKLMEDALSTGKVASSSSYLQEYITVIDKGSEYKLNINNYIGRTKIDKTRTINDVTINIINKETYMDYSEYTLKIQNNTQNTVLLDNGEETESIYLLDENEVAEYASSSEILYSTLKLAPNESKTYTFKFLNTYSSTRVMRYLVFKNVIMDYEEYEKTADKSNYNFTSIAVNV